MSNYFDCARLKGRLTYETCVRRQFANGGVKSSDWSPNRATVTYDICIGCMRGAAIRKRYGQGVKLNRRVYQSNHKGHEEGVKSHNRRRVLDAMRERSIAKTKETRSE